MATLQHPTTVRNTIANTVVDLIDAGAGAGELKFFTSNGGSLLATLTFSDPAFGAASAGAAAANAFMQYQASLLAGKK